MSGTRGATDLGSLSLMLINAACKPEGTSDQSDSVSFVGSGISAKLKHVFLGCLFSHEIGIKTVNPNTMHTAKRLNGVDTFIILFFIFDMSDGNSDGSVNGFDKYFPMGVGHSVGGEQTDAGCPVFYGYVDGFAQFFGR